MARIRDILLKNFLAHLSASVIFQLGSQPLCIQWYLTWHSGHMSLRWSGPASNLYDRLPQGLIKRLVFLPKNFQKKSILFPKPWIPCSTWSTLPLGKKVNGIVRFYAFKVETFFSNKASFSKYQTRTSQLICYTSKFCSTLCSSHRDKMATSKVLATNTKPPHYAINYV